MKIDGSRVADDLLQRMQEAHEQQKTSQIDKADGQKTFSLDQVRSAQETQKTSEVEKTSLQTRLQTTAEKALRGEFKDAAAVREAVVEDILREKWEPKVGRAKAAQMLRTLKPTLVDDPTFTRQVDEMLILAARNVGPSR